MAQMLRKIPYNSFSPEQELRLLITCSWIKKELLLQTPYLCKLKIILNNDGRIFLCKDKKSDNYLFITGCDGNNYGYILVELTDYEFFVYRNTKIISLIELIKTKEHIFWIELCGNDIKSFKIKTEELK